MEFAPHELVSSGDPMEPAAATHTLVIFRDSASLSIIGSEIRVIHLIVDSLMKPTSRIALPVNRPDYKRREPIRNQMFPRIMWLMR
jgi:hypothetical protein